MYKLQTKISFFRYGEIVQTEPLLVTWFKFDKQNKGICFSKEELELFSNFAKSQPANFEILLPFDCYENSADFISNSKHFASSAYSIPHIFILGYAHVTYS